MSVWNIPDWLEREIKDRDQNCVYCCTEFGSSKETRKSVATWEHIVNDARMVNRESIARCCFSCNSSKGTKRLSIGSNLIIARNAGSARIQSLKW